MEKQKTPQSPFDLLGPNGDIYRCKVDSTQEESVIRLLNQKTGDKWFGRPNLVLLVAVVMPTCLRSVIAGPVT
jgi:hypothetical protein